MFSRQRWWSVFALVLGGFISSHSFAAEAKVPAKPGVDPSNDLVERALIAELKGDAAERAKLLAEAVKYDPNNVVARWHLGQIRIGDEWLSLEDAEAQTAKTGTIAEYRQLREKSPATEAGHVAAARWCRKHELREQEKLHWMMVLQFDYKNQEARSRLGLKEYAGRLLTTEAIEQEKAWRKETEKAATYWRDWVKERRAVLQKSDSASIAQALSEIKEVKEPVAIFALEGGLSTFQEAAALAVVEALSQMKHQVATDSLVRHAVLSDSAKVREAAMAELKARPLHTYVPILLSNLKAPVEFAQTSYAFGDGMSRSFVFEREGQKSVVCDIKALNKLVSLVNKPGMDLQASELIRQGMWLDARAEWEKGTQIKLVVDQANKANEPLNQRIYATLKCCTEEDLGDDVPRKWWQWWEEFNEVAYSSAVKPTNYSIAESRYQTRNYRVFSQAERFTHSCFLRGTLVTTETGPMPIEQVRPGDRVLAQNTETGEIAYKAVLDTSIRPPRETRQIVLPGETIVATLGHPFWVDGKGWRLSKELQPGDILHGVTGGVKVQAVEKGAEAEVYNMVVADFNSYFVGKSRVLVHDNRALVVSQAAVPGMFVEQGE